MNYVSENCNEIEIKHASDNHDLYGLYEKVNETIGNKEYFLSKNKKYAMWFHGGLWSIGKAENKGTDQYIYYNPTIGKPSFDAEKCSNSQYVANGICNDETNTEDCAWDGGDCCLREITKKHCEACECLDPMSNNTRKPREDITMSKLFRYF